MSISIQVMNQRTKKTKRIYKPDGYPVCLCDEIRLRSWKDNNDIWIVMEMHEINKARQ